MKHIKTYLIESKTNFLIKGHTKNQNEVITIHKIYKFIDNWLSYNIGDEIEYNVLNSTIAVGSQTKIFSQSYILTYTYKRKKLEIDFKELFKELEKKFDCISIQTETKTNNTKDYSILYKYSENHFLNIYKIITRRKQINKHIYKLK